MYSKLRYQVITGRHQLRSPRVVVLQAESSIQTGYYSSKERTYNYRNINNININNNDNNNTIIDDTNRRTSGRTTVVGKASIKYQGSKSSNVSSSRSSSSNYFPKGLGAEIKKKIRDVFYSNNSNSDQESDIDSDIFNKGNTDGNNRNNNIGRVYLNNIKKSSSSSSLSSTYYDMKLLDIMTQHRHQLNHHHVITLLYYSAVMRYNDVLSFLSIHEIITIFQKSKRLFTSTELAKALYGICRFDDDTIDIKLLIHYLTEQQLKAFKGSLSGQEIAQSLYGLQGISNSNSDDDVVVESLLDALYNIIVHTIQKTSQDNIDKIVMNAQEISNALYGKIKLVIHSSSHHHHHHHHHHHTCLDGWMDG